jgi:hypothetical protein
MDEALRHVEVVDIEIQILQTFFRVVVVWCYVDASDLKPSVSEREFSARQTTLSGTIALKAAFWTHPNVPLTVVG